MSQTRDNRLPTTPAPRRPEDSPWRRVWARHGPPPHATTMAGWALLPLRLFLGGTFVFAGLQKIANPGFFDRSNPTSIQAQLASAARVSPIHGLVAHLEPHAVAVGVVMALGEIAVGAGTLAGLWSRVAAAGGMLLSFGLFLTVSFHSSPYYTGSDIVFVFAWTPLLVAGAGGVLSVDAAGTRHGPGPKRRGARHDGPDPFRGGAEGVRVLRRRRLSCPFGRAVRACSLPLSPCGLGHDPGRRARRHRPSHLHAAGHVRRRRGGRGARRHRSGGGPRQARRQVAAVRHASGSSPSTSGASGPTGTTGTGTGTGTGSSTPTTTPVKKPAGTRIGAAASVPVGGSATFQDPRSGDPGIVVHLDAGTFAAFDAVCPHEGCIVAYSPPAGRFICPCHGSQFNGKTGDVLQGPAPRGLGRIPVEGSAGELYVT